VPFEMDILDYIYRSRGQKWPKIWTMKRLYPRCEAPISIAQLSIAGKVVGMMNCSEWPAKIGVLEDGRDRRSWRLKCFGTE
jgi:hypothetical protein